jgi:hypothetical protein
MNYQTSNIMRAQFLKEAPSRVPQPPKDIPILSPEDRLERLKNKREVYYFRYSRPKPKR